MQEVEIPSPPPGQIQKIECGLCEMPIRDPKALHILRSGHSCLVHVECYVTALRSLT